MEAQDGPALRARKARQELLGLDPTDVVAEKSNGAAACGYQDERDQDGGACCDETPPKSPGGSKRAQELWRKVKKQYDLVEYHVLPEYLRDNEYILRHYRSDWPMKETLLSMFTIHNETLNIWT